MQDYDKHKIDDEFTDFAWNKMQQTLDREMPQRKKRRAIIWWWLSGCLLLGGVVGLYSLTESPDTPVHKTVMEAEIVADEVQNKKSIASTTNIDAKENKVSKTTDVSSKKHINNNETKALKENEIIINKDKISATHSIMQKGISPTLPTLPNDKAINRRIPTLAFLANEFQLLESPHPIIFKNKNSINTLAILPFDLLSYHSSIKEIKGGEVEKKQQKNNENKLCFGLTAGSYFNKNAKWNGFSFGGVLEHKFNKRFSIQAGLQYTALRTHFYSTTETNKRTIVEVPFDESTVDSPEITIESVYSDSITYDTLFESTTTTTKKNYYIHYLEMPLFAKYTTKWKIGIHAGIQLSYLLTKNNIPDFLKENINRFGLSAVGGIHYFPKPNWGFQLQYRRVIWDDLRNNILSESALDNDSFNTSVQGNAADESFTGYKIKKNQSFNCSFIYYFGQ